MSHFPTAFVRIHHDSVTQDCFPQRTLSSSISVWGYEDSILSFHQSARNCVDREENELKRLLPDFSSQSRLVNTKLYTSPWTLVPHANVNFLKRHFNPTLRPRLLPAKGTLVGFDGSLAFKSSARSPPKLRIARLRAHRVSEPSLSRPSSSSEQRLLPKSVGLSVFVRRKLRLVDQLLTVAWFEYSCRAIPLRQPPPHSCILCPSSAG